MAKLDDGSVPMTLQFPGDIYYYLKKIADLDRRSMNQEVFFLIEQAAKKMKVQLDLNNENVMRHIAATVPVNEGAGPRKKARTEEEAKTGT